MVIVFFRHRGKNVSALAPHVWNWFFMCFSIAQLQRWPRCRNTCKYDTAAAHGGFTSLPALALLFLPQHGGLLPSTISAGSAHVLHTQTKIPAILICLFKKEQRWEGAKHDGKGQPGGHTPCQRTPLSARTHTHTRTRRKRAFHFKASKRRKPSEPRVY